MFCAKLTWHTPQLIKEQMLKFSPTGWQSVIQLGS